MKLAFCLFKYFPYGGLQRDFLRIAKVCRARGHEVHVFTMHWEGEVESQFHLHVLKPSGWQNHARCHAFIKLFYAYLQTETFDVVIGFNKMPHLDFYYAADVCYQGRIKTQRNPLYRLLPRYRRWVEMEEAVFARGKKTKVMLLSALQETQYRYYYNTEPERFFLLPPGIEADRMVKADAAAIRKKVRATCQITAEQYLLLMVGSGFKTKGLDRTLRSLAALPYPLQQQCRLIVIGKDNPKKFIQLARQLGIEDLIRFLGGRTDVTDFLLAADLLLHPSYHENTGTVLLEAMATGLPVLTVAACGYASYISEADAGKVVAAPFRQAAWNIELETMLLSTKRPEWAKNGLAYVAASDIYSLPEKAADLIDHAGV